MRDVAGLGREEVEEVDCSGTALTADAARALVLEVITRHADSLLRTARRHSLCSDDAHDAYQRTMEIFVRRAPTLDPELAFKWIHTVCKHEAMAVRRQRQDLVAADDVDFDREEARHLPSPDERVVSFEHLQRSAEALRRLKPQEVQALWLKAEGHSYEEICRLTGWTYTKVNRCMAEGRRAFLARYAGIEAGEECERWQPVLSAMVDGEASPEEVLEARPHLRNCAACRATVRELHQSAAPLAALFPVAAGPALAERVHEPSGFLVRLYEALTSGLHERAAATVLKAQAAIDTASAAKVAAIAASAAAIAGGGAAVVVDEAARHPRAHRQPTASHDPRHATPQSTHLRPVSLSPTAPTNAPSSSRTPRTPAPPTHHHAVLRTPGKTREFVHRRHRDKIASHEFSSPTPQSTTASAASTQSPEPISSSPPPPPRPTPHRSAPTKRANNEFGP